ncbi:MAG: zinc ribbon domain-containing protein [Lachnospiraceae bacterium]|nr:zinc ribbon domain-containing protein [Lachnospiraceae bacterium]
MVCKNCGNLLEDGVKFCTKCGQRVEEVVAEVKEAAAEATAEVTEAAAEVQEKAEEATAEVKETVAEAQETVAEAKEEVKEEANDVKEKVADVAEEVKETVTEVATEVKEKVKKFPKGALIAIGAIALVLILIIANFKSVANSVNKLVSSEEKYYASVEKDGIKELASSAADIYENSFLEYYSDYNDTSVDLGVEVELGEDAAEMLAAAVGSDDEKAFAKMAFDLFMSYKGDVLSAEASATLGKTELISADGVLDLKKGQAFGRIEELSSKYIGVSFEDYADMISEGIKQGDEFIELLPKKKTVESLVNRYMTIVIDNLDNVSEKKDTISVGDIEQKCTAIRVRIKEKDINKIAIAVLEEAKDDKELIGLISDFAAAGAAVYGEEMDAKDIEDEFKESIEAALDEMKEAEDSEDDEDSEDEEELIMIVYVNGKGEVIGRELKINDETVLVYEMPEKGSKFALKAAIIDGEDEVIFEGEGKKSSSSLSGEFALKVKEDGEKAVKFIEVDVDKFDTKKIKEGFLNGTFTFKLSDEFLKEADVAMAGAILGDYNIKCVFKSSKNNSYVEIALMDKDEMFAAIKMDAKVGSGKSASLPKGILVEDEEDIIEWVQTINFEKFVKNLEKAGLPIEIVEEIEDYCEEIEDMLSDY